MVVFAGVIVVVLLCCCPFAVAPSRCTVPELNERLQRKQIHFYNRRSVRCEPRKIILCASLRELFNNVVMCYGTVRFRCFLPWRSTQRHSIYEYEQMADSMR